MAASYNLQEAYDLDVRCVFLSSKQILEEVCEKNRWGKPTYHLLKTIRNNTAAADGSGDVQLFAFKVIAL